MTAREWLARAKITTIMNVTMTSKAADIHDELPVGSARLSVKSFVDALFLFSCLDTGVYTTMPKRER